MHRDLHSSLGNFNQWQRIQNSIHSPTHRDQQAHCRSHMNGTWFARGMCLGMRGSFTASQQSTHTDKESPAHAGCLVSGQGSLFISVTHGPRTKTYLAALTPLTRDLKQVGSHACIEICIASWMSLTSGKAANLQYEALHTGINRLITGLMWMGQVLQGVWA